MRACSVRFDDLFQLSAARSSQAIRGLLLLLSIKPNAQSQRGGQSIEIAALSIGGQNGLSECDHRF